MDREKISKMVNAKYRTGDNLIGKEFMFRFIPEVKSHIRDLGDKKLIDKRELTKYNIYLQGKKHVLQFEKEDFPELWIDKTEE